MNTPARTNTPALLRRLAAGACLALLIGLAPDAHAQRSDEALERSYLAANGMLNRGMNEMAIEEYRAFLDEAPNHAKAPVARYGLGVALTRLGRHAEAIRALSAIDLDASFDFRAEALLLLAQAHLTTGEPLEAVAPLRTLLDDHPDHALAEDAAALRAEALYRAGDEAAAERAALEALRDRPESRHRSRLELLAAMAAIAQGNDAEAVERLQALLEREPDGAYADRATLLLAQAQRRRGLAQEAIRAYRRVVQTATDALEADALWGLATLLRRAGDEGDAAHALDRFLERHPNDSRAGEAHLERAQAALAMDDPRRAREALRRARQSGGAPDDEVAYWTAKTSLRMDKPAEAADALTDAIESYPNGALAPEMRYDLGVASIRADRPEDAAEALRAFRARHDGHPLEPEAIRLLAGVEHRQGRYDASRALCDEYLNRFPEGDAVASIEFLAAENAYLLADLEPAAAAFADLLERRPDHEQADLARLRLGAARHALGDLDDADAALAPLTERDVETGFEQALLLRGDIAFARAEWEQAADLLERFVRTEPTAASDDALLKLGLARRRLGDEPAALRAFERLAESASDSPAAEQGAFERAQSLLALDRLDDAREAFESLLDRWPDARFEAAALLHLGSIAHRQGDPARAAEILAHAAAAADNPGVRRDALARRGEALLGAGETDRAIESLRAALAEPAAPNGQAARLRANLAIALSRAERAEEALDAFEQMSERAWAALPPDLKAAALYERAWAQREQGRPLDAVASLERLLVADPDPALRVSALVKLAELRGDASDDAAAAAALEEALALVDQGAAVSPTLVERAAYYLGWSLYETERYDEAAERLDWLLARFPEGELRAQASMLCGEALHARARYIAATPHYERVVEDHEDFRSHRIAMLRLADCHAQTQRWARSEDVFVDFLEAHADDSLWFRAQFGVGWARENQQRYAEAIEAYRAVVDRHNGAMAARAQFQIGECLFAMGEHEKAARELLKVDILYAAPEWSAAALFEAGRCFEALADRASARDQFTRVVEEHPQTEWATRAARRLEALASPDLPGRGD